MEWQIPTFLMKKWRRMQKGRFYTRQMNPVCKTPCFTHGPIIPCVKSQHLLTTLAKMESPYANRPVLYTANESCMQNPVFYARHRQRWSPRMQIGLFYTRQMNLVCKTPCFTHGPIIPCVKSQHLLTTLAKMASPYANRPVLHTANESRMQNPVFYSRPWPKQCSRV